MDRHPAVTRYFFWYYLLFYLFIFYFSRSLDSRTLAFESSTYTLPGSAMEDSCHTVYINTLYTANRCIDFDKMAYTTDDIVISYADDNTLL